MSHRYPSITSFDLRRTEVAPIGNEPDYHKLIHADRDINHHFKHFEIHGVSRVTRQWKCLHEYKVSVRDRTYVVSNIVLTDGEEINARRHTNMKLYDMIIANYRAAGGDPPSLRYIVFTDTTSDVVDAAITREYNEQVRLRLVDGDPNSSSPIVLRQDRLQAQLGINPLLRCVAKVIGKINTLHHTRKAFSWVEMWPNRYWGTAYAEGHHLVVCLH